MRDRGGANPAFSLEFTEAEGLSYVLLDISTAELRKAPRGYVTMCADITAPLSVPEVGYDLVFSRMLAVRRPRFTSYTPKLWTGVRRKAAYLPG